MVDNGSQGVESVEVRTLDHSATGLEIRETKPNKLARNKSNQWIVNASIMQLGKFKEILPFWIGGVCCLMAFDPARRR